MYFVSQTGGIVYVIQQGPRDAGTAAFWRRYLHTGHLIRLLRADCRLVDHLQQYGPLRQPGRKRDPLV